MCVNSYYKYSNSMATRGPNWSGLKEIAQVLDLHCDTIGRVVKPAQSDQLQANQEKSL